MHPPLHRPHPLCQEEIRALEECHRIYSFRKWFGYCNEAKWALDRCFREEKQIRRRENYEKSLGTRNAPTPPIAASQ